MNTSFPCYGIIPARYGSSRLPAKALALIAGKPMFWHVYTRARQCVRLSGVWLATDDTRIAEAARVLDVPCVMTDTRHQSGTDRVYEAVQQLALPDSSVLVNIQGDEPELKPELLDELLAAFADPAVQVSTAATCISAVEAASPDQVKVVRAANGDALYFSRALIPHARDGGQGEYLGHIGLYAFRKKALALFTSLAPSPLEQLEKLEQLRLLEHGLAIRVVLSSHCSHGVDTEADLAAVRQRLG